MRLRRLARDLSDDEPREPTDAPRRLGVALSGGGVRASLFALGALMLFVDSGENERVTEMCSVSGGSITNAFVAQRCNFQTVSRADFDQCASQLALAIVRGLVTKRFVLTTYGVAGLFVIILTMSSWPLDLPTYLDIALIAVFGALVLLRGVVLTHLFQRQLFGAAQLPKTLGSITSNVAHVFCATDLNASMPVYFTNAGVHFL